MRCARSRRLLDDLVTEDVSASGLRLRAEEPHGLRAGDRVEIRLFARVKGPLSEDTLVMATDAVVVRAARWRAALSFEGPLAY